MNFANIPVEILEKIMICLDDETLIASTKVCSLWEQVAKRLIWHRSLHNIPGDVICEIVGSALTEKTIAPQTWELVYSRWLCSKIEDASPTNVCYVSIEDEIICYKITGDYLIASYQSGQVVMFNNKGETVNNLVNAGAVVWDVGVLDVQNKGSYKLGNANDQDLWREHDYMLLVGDRFVQLYKLPEQENASCNLVWGVNDLNSISIPKSSVFGSLFAVAERPTVLTIRSVTLPKKNTVSVTEVHQIVCNTWLWKWKIWKTKVICILATGEIAVWSLETGLWLSISQRFPELLYQNPSFIYRGVIFCSSRTSQSLLEYWHCFPGDSYWLVCWDGEMLHKYCPKSLMGDDVTAVCMKRRLVALGTASGKLFLYDHKGPDSEIGHIWESHPITAFQVSDRPIRSCDLGFDGSALTIAARIGKNSLILLQWPNAKTLLRLCESEIDVDKELPT